MNSRLLKAKRIEHGLRQIDLAQKLQITEKTMNKKECSSKNCFTADEMLSLAKILSLSPSEFNNIFFDNDLPFWLSLWLIANHGEEGGERTVSEEKPNINRLPLKGLSAEEMFQKILQHVDQHTDAEIRMERDGSYKVFTIKRKTV